MVGHPFLSVHHALGEVDGEQTMNFLQSSSWRNVDTYILDQSKLVEATEKQESLLDTDGPIEVFSRLYMRRSTYTSQSYARGISGKRKECFPNYM